jgi:hypothetical protein
MLNPKGIEWKRYQARTTIEGIEFTPESLGCGLILLTLLLLPLFAAPLLVLVLPHKVRDFPARHPPILILHQV